MFNHAISCLTGSPFVLDVVCVWQNWVGARYAVYPGKFHPKVVWGRCTGAKICLSASLRLDPALSFSASRSPASFGLAGNGCFVGHPPGTQTNVLSVSA